MSNREAIRQELYELTRHYERIGHTSTAVSLEDTTHAWDALVSERDALLDACQAALANLDRLVEVWGAEGVTRGVQDRLRAAVEMATQEEPTR